LSILRGGEKEIGAAPILKGNALSRIVIADLAMTMLECLHKDVGQNLICLLQELLDVDRHRKASSAKEDRTKFENAARTEARLRVQGKIRTVREFAKLLFVSPSTLIGWRKSEDYRDLVSRWEEYWSAHLPPTL
jgi:hypothetical protein